MDTGAHKLLESVTLKTLHAHSFARSSAQASQVMTDLLSRYLLLVSTTCAQYAHHAGRTDLTPGDAISALDELGVSMDELHEYCGHEGEELARYSGHSAKRIDDLHDFKAALNIGRPSPREPIPLVYAPLPDSFLSDDEEVDVEDEGAYEEEEKMEEGAELEAGVERRGEVPVLRGSPQRIETRPPSPPRPPSTPPLPLSPISNPSSPARKRARTENWKPPSHIPSFLPPFPAERTSPEPEPLSLPPPAESPSSTHPSPIKIERAVSPPRPLSGSSPADYTSVVPYSESSLASHPEWHLPSSLPPPLQHPAASVSLLVPQVQPSLLAAYHHILTHPPPANPNAANPSRHRVAMALLHQSQRNPRWEPADTLYASTPPNPPAVAAIGPSHAVVVGISSPGSDDKKDKEEETKLPSAPARPVATLERITPLVSQQTSRIPELARQILPGAVYARTTRLAHPPVLSRGPDKLTYGPGVAAPWNSTGGPSAPVLPTPTSAKGKESTVNGLSNGKGKEPVEKKALPDARFFATWDYEQKSFREPLVAPRRARQGSIQSSVLSAGAPGRGRSESTQSRG